jgi:hypothetical protein
VARAWIVARLGSAGHGEPPRGLSRGDTPGGLRRSLDASAAHPADHASRSRAAPERLESSTSSLRDPACSSIPPHDGLVRSVIGVYGLLPLCARPVEGPLGRPALLRRGRRLRRQSAHLPVAGQITPACPYATINAADVVDSHRRRSDHGLARRTPLDAAAPGTACAPAGAVRGPAQHVRETPEPPPRNLRRWT